MTPIERISDEFEKLWDGMGLLRLAIEAAQPTTSLDVDTLRTACQVLRDINHLDDHRIIAAKCHEQARLIQTWIDSNCGPAPAPLGDWAEVEALAAECDALGERMADHDWLHKKLVRFASTLRDAKSKHDQELVDALGREKVLADLLRRWLSAPQFASLVAAQRDLRNDTETALDAPVQAAGAEAKP